MFDVAVFGRTVWDAWRGLPKRHSRHVFFGGPGANIAVHLSRLGLRCTLFTVLGTGPASRTYEAHLRDVGVDLTYASRVDRDLPSCEMWVDRKRGHTWLGGYDGLLALERVHIPGDLQVAECTFFADFPLCGIDSLPPATRHYCSPQLTLFNGQTSVDDVYRLPWDAVFLNAKEAAFVRAHCAGNIWEKLIARGTCIVTNEDRPTDLHQQAQCTSFPVQPVHCVSSVGGGDAFAAGAVAALERGLDISSAITIGHAAAGIVVREIGCQTASLTWRSILQ